ncbi:MAG: T9SS type A sorting domain-containing protein [Muribaculaceae bacterium]|nr:T9SS type A sorting domain-containing protein [Muribaculaceae bacterium]MDE5929568.1 T9SS type A sorting domain-containing protein [Muribaculaceae bacterium]
MKKLYLILSLAVMMLGSARVSAVAMSEPYVQEAVAEAVEFSVRGHQLDIINNSDDSRQVVIYALTGQVVKQLEAHPGTTTVELGAGYYIVKVEKHSKRIVIR